MRLKKAFKKLEKLQRVLRQRLSPRAWIFVHGFKKSFAASGPAPTRSVLIDLKNPEADADAGRDVALLVHYFRLSGYSIILAPNHHFIASFRNKRYKKALLKDGSSLSQTRKMQT